MKSIFFGASVLLGACAVLAPASAQTLKAVQDRGILSCGVSQGLPGFSTP
ncbi:MAG TPA: amino acid ABC transporter substrate-binding protein, partial [Afipia sp.]